MESIIVGLMVVVAVVGWYYLRDQHKKELDKLISNIGNIFSVRDDLHTTLLTGLYHRFKKEEGKTECTPYDFERFVARVMQTNISGSAEVTRGSGDGGIDILHSRGDGLYLGQVKCYAANDLVNYIPIAVLHSQMIKQGAKGGFFVTTSDFNDNAVDYAEGLGITLINGEKFVELWVEAMEKTKESLFPVFNSISSK